MNKDINYLTDAIKIVPLHQTKSSVSINDLTESKVGGKGQGSSKKTAKPLLIYNGGAVIENVEVYTIFWGQNWETDPLYKTMSQNINNFFTAILKSPLMDQLAEYSTHNPKHTIGYGSLAGTKTFATLAPAAGTSITDSAIQTALNGWIHDGIVAPVSANSLYFIYTGVDVKVIMGGSASCTGFCGYHNNMGSIYYAVMPFPNCAGCLGGLSEIDALTATSSHELCEAITDPVPGAGWYDQVNGEIGDICAWKFKKIAGYTVQSEWSNKTGTCL